MAFQIMDDAMDYSQSSAAMGKNRGDDFLDQKITLPMILAYGDGDGAERNFWHKTMRDGDFADGDFDKAHSILQRHNAIERSIAKAVTYASANALRCWHALTVQQTLIFEEATQFTRP